MEVPVNRITAEEVRRKGLDHADKVVESEIDAIFEQIHRSTTNYTMGFSTRIYEGNFTKISKVLGELGYSVERLDINGDPSLITVKWS